MLIENTQDKTFKWIMFALAFLALGVITSPTIVSGYHIFMIIPAIIIYRRKLYKVEMPLSSWFLLALFFWGIICTIYNLDTVVKPRKSFDDLKFYLLGFALIVPLRYVIDRIQEAQIKVLLNIFYFTLIAAFFVGVSKAYWGFDVVKFEFGEFKNRSDGFTNYMRYGYASAFVVIFSVAMWINREKISGLLNWKFFYPAAVLSLLAIFTSQTRGALLAVLVGLPWLLLRYKPKIAASIIGLGTAFVAIVVYISFFSVNNTGSRFFNIKDGSNMKRMSQFYSAVKSVQEKPVFGLGSDQFSYNVTRLKKEYDIWSQQYSGHSHNIYLEHAANFGIIGLFLILGFFITWFWEMFKLGGDFGWAMTAYIVAFNVSGQVELLFDNTNSHILFFAYSFSQAFRYTQKSVR